MSPKSSLVWNIQFFFWSSSSRSCVVNDLPGVENEKGAAATPSIEPREERSPPQGSFINRLPRWVPVA
ncbi:MAG: hypothetical protein ACYC23_06725 [Limisphaerales bacterium]